MKANLAKLGLLAAGAFLIHGAVDAQNLEEVTVQAKRIVKKVVGRSSTGVPIEDISLSYGVSAAGLDLGSGAGASELERRVKDAATAACEEIGRQYPDATPSDRECARIAADQAMVKARELIAAAKKTPGK